VEGFAAAVTLNVAPETPEYGEAVNHAVFDCEVHDD